MTSYREPSQEQKDRIAELEKELQKITKRNDDLLETQNSYRLLLENSADVVWVKDLDQRATYYSPSVFDFRGYTPEEAMALGAQGTVTNESLEAGKKVVLDIMIKAETEPKDALLSFCTEQECLCKDGSTKWAECVGTLMRDENDKPVGLHGIARDITEKIQMRTELEKKDEMLHAQSRELEETNKAYHLLADQVANTAQEQKSKIQDSMDVLVRPYLDALKKTDLTSDQLICLRVINSIYFEVLSYTPGQTEAQLDSFSPKETEVARLVSIGCTSVDIARILGMPRRSVDFHRARIRKKIGLKESGQNLSEALASIFREKRQTPVDSFI